MKCSSRRPRTPSPRRGPAIPTLRQSAAVHRAKGRHAFAQSAPSSATIFEFWGPLTTCQERYLQGSSAPGPSHQVTLRRFFSRRIPASARMPCAFGSKNQRRVNDERADRLCNLGSLAGRPQFGNRPSTARSSPGIPVPVVSQQRSFHFGLSVARARKAQTAKPPVIARPNAVIQLGTDRPAMATGQP